MHRAQYKKTFLDVSGFDDAWSFIDGVLYPGLYPDAWYNSDPFDGNAHRHCFFIFM